MTDLPNVLILGGGELGSAVAHRLARAGMQVVIVDLARPTCIRRAVCFATALTRGSIRVEGVGAARAASIAGAPAIARSGRIPVLALEGEAGVPVARMARALGARFVVDARMLKRAGAISRRSAPLVIGLGPGLRAGRDAHVIVETNRGHNLGRLILKGTAEPNTGRPAEIGGRASERVVRAPVAGVFKCRVEIGKMVRKGQIVGKVAPRRMEEGARRGTFQAVKQPGVRGGNRKLRDDGGIPVRASIQGLLRGLIADHSRVGRGQKIGDIDPRGLAVDPFTISDKGRAVAGGVLEAIINWWVNRDGRR